MKMTDGAKKKIVMSHLKKCLSHGNQNMNLQTRKNQKL